MKRRCDACKWWHDDGAFHVNASNHVDDAWSLCRRFPPVLNPEQLRDDIEADEQEPLVAIRNGWNWSFPVVRGSEWCGEFQPRENRGQMLTPCELMRLHGWRDAWSARAVELLRSDYSVDEVSKILRVRKNTKRHQRLVTLAAEIKQGANVKWEEPKAPVEYEEPQTTWEEPQTTIEEPEE